MTVYKPVEEFDPQSVRDAHQELSDLREEITVEHAELMFDFQSILNNQQYRLLVNSRAHMYQCSLGLSKFYRRIIGDWMNRNSETQ